MHDVENNSLTIEQRHGNYAADYWAGEAAKTFQIDNEQINIVNKTDADAWQVQKRLIAIVKNFSTKIDRIPNPPIPKININQQKAIELGHSIDYTMTE